MTMTATEQMAQAMDEIRHLAATRKHNLGPSMCGTRSMTPVQVRMVLIKLRSCPEIEQEPPVAAPEPAPEPASAVPPKLGAFKDTPAGYYATPPRDGSDAIDFWLVERPKDGKWAGYAFARRVLGGPADEGRKLRSVRLENMQQRLALQAITEYGLDAAQILFADTMERCMDCSTPLTDPVSRAERRGPTCRSKKR